MNPQRGFKGITLVISIAVFLFSFLSGCSTPPEPLTAKESRMSEELLRSQVLKYKAEVEKELSEMDDFFSQYGSPLDTPFTPEIVASISTALATLVEDREMGGTMINYSSGIDRYYLFYEKLEEKGGDMNGLEIDFITPIQKKNYSPPIEPQFPSPDFKTVAGV